MKIFCAACLAILLAGLPSLAIADDFDALLKLWSNKKYVEVLPRLFAYRRGPLGRTWKVDYMIGTSECHGGGDVHLGAEYLKHVLVYRDVTDKARADTAYELQHCADQPSAAASQAAPESFALVPVAGQLQPAGASVSGKGGYTMIATNRAAATSMQALVPVSVEELHRRLYPPQQAAQALQAAKDRLQSRPGSPKPSGIVLNQYVVACGSGNDFCLEEVPGQAARCLTRYEAPLRQEFTILRPDQLITVYVATDVAEVPVLAQRLHGVALPFGTVAYSVREDLSMVGLMGADGCGSLAHELVHLSIRSNFGDSPAWLEEGLASEIAVAMPRARDFQFAPSWRDDMLRAQISRRPSVAQLLATSWTDFAALDRDSIPKVAATHAMAAVFVRYLDARGKLAAVYSAIRDGHFPEDGTMPRSDQAILEEQLGAPVAAIDQDFMKWFDSPTDQPAAQY